MTKHTNTHYAIKEGGIQDTCGLIDEGDVIDYLGRTGLSMHYYCPLCGELMEVHPYDEDDYPTEDVVEFADPPKEE